VRDDDGKWNRAGGRKELNDIVVSHGLCPECAKRYKAEIVKLIRD